MCENSLFVSCVCLFVELQMLANENGKISLDDDILRMYSKKQIRKKKKNVRKKDEANVGGTTKKKDVEMFNHS